MDSRWLGVIVLVIIIVLGGWYVYAHPMKSQTPSTAAMNMASTTMASSTTPTDGTVPAPVTVTYTGQGFSPKSVTVAQGQAVTFVNQSSGQMWVASDPHPTHSGYDGTSRTTHCAPGYAGAAPFDECAQVASGGSFTFTFDKAGTWGYHNHADDAVKGTVVVTPAMPATGESASTTVNVQVQ